VFVGTVLASEVKKSSRILQKKKKARTRIFELPPDDAVPLVEFQRKVTMTSNPFCVVLSDDQQGEKLFESMRTYMDTSQSPMSDEWQ
jgi:hypothetical protein